MSHSTPIRWWQGQDPRSRPHKGPPAPRSFFAWFGDHSFPAGDRIAEVSPSTPSTSPPSAPNTPLTPPPPKKISPPRSSRRNYGQTRCSSTCWARAPRGSLKGQPHCRGVARGYPGILGVPGKEPQSFIPPLANAPTYSESGEDCVVIVDDDEDVQEILDDGDGK